MLVTMMEDYDSFLCTAQGCRHNCCLGGWEIELDEETVRKYQTVSGEMGEKLRRSVQQIPEYCFQLEEGRCSFLKEDGLCGIYEELGEEYMGRVCREFPRFMEYYGEEKETGLGLACEEAGRMLFSKVGRMQLVTRDLPKDICCETEEIDLSFYEFLKVVRKQSIAMLQERSKPLFLQCAKVLSLARMLQDRINDGTWQQCEVLQMFKECNDKIEIKSDKSSEELMENLLYDCSDLAVLEEEWAMMREKMIKHVQEENWQQDTNEFINSQPMIDIQYEQLLVYYVFRYFTQAVYDNNLLDKARFMAVSLLLIREMNVLIWKEKKSFTLEDQVECNRIYSRQMEYSQDNMEAFCDMFLFENDYTIQNIQKNLLLL